MRLLLLDQFSEPGGAQQCLLDLLPAIGERGWQVVVGLPGEGSLFRRVREMGLEAARVDCGPYSMGTKSITDMGRFVMGTPRLARQIRGLAAGLNAELVYINGPRLLPAAALAGLRCPVVFHSHSFLFPGAIRKLTGLSLRRANAWVIASCRFVAEPWTPYVRPERLSVIYNGVTGPDAVAPRARAGPLRVGCLGRIAPEKGQREFLAAAAIIHRVLPDCRFAIYGAPLFSDGRYAEEVRAAAAGLPVEFAGWVRDVYPALAELDLVLAPSAAHEATTRVILEAFAAAVPVVAFRSGGIPEVIGHGHGGWLAGSVEEMAQRAIELLMAGPEVRARATAEARENWERRFRIGRWREEVLARLEVVRTTTAPFR